MKTGNQFEVLKKLSEGVTNVTIVCSDGIINTHKIIVASTNKLLKSAMEDITCNDDITVLCIDFNRNEIEDFLFANLMTYLPHFVLC